jgi:hypothetical protein
VVLKGEAKTKYMREYMRRRRAGQSAKPKPQERPAAKAAPPADAKELARREAAAASNARVHELEARNAALENQIETLKAKIADREYYLEREQKAHARLEYALGRFRAGKGVASAKAFRVIDLCLHPDTRGQVTDKQADQAMVIWNWCRERLVGKDAKTAKPEKQKRTATKRELR